MGIARTLRSLAVALAVAALLAAASPAWAASPPNGPPPLPGMGGVAPNVPVLPVDRGPVPANVWVAGRDLGGLSEYEALSVIKAYVKPGDLPPLTVAAGGNTFTFASASAFYVDARAMLEQAYLADGVSTIVLTPRYGYDVRAARSFVSQIAKSDRKTSDARWYLSQKRLKLQPSAVGQSTDRSGAYFMLLTAMRAEARTGAEQPVVNLPVKTVAPRITEKNVGRAILVVRTEFYLRLYDPANGGYQMRGYNCAVGQPGYPTPLGNWKIIEKRYMPTWVNPGSSWAKNMPPYIGPGPNNPLGTRALNLNVDAIRIHGTEKVASIGTPASRGCVRLVRKDIEELYDLVVVGTPVFIID